MGILGLSISGTTPVINGAGFWIRALARLIDTGTSMIIAYLSGLSAGMVLVFLQAASVIAPGWPLRLRGHRAVIFAGGLMAPVVYHTVCEGFHGATLGKYLCRLRVLAVDLKPCGMKPALLRSLAYYFDGLFFGVVGYLKMAGTSLKQRYGDHWAATVVLHSGQVPESSRRPGERFVLALAVAAASSGVVVGLACIVAAW